MIGNSLLLITLLIILKMQNPHKIL